MQSQDEQWLLSEKYGGEKTEGFFTDCERLKAGEPLGYVIGYVPFLVCKIFLDSHPLIARPETEYWVEKAISAIKQPTTNLANKRPAAGGFGWGDAGASESGLSWAASPIRVLDLCAGSGAIGVAIAKAVPEAHVTFGEIDKTHLPTIGKNLDANEISCTRYQVFQSDLFENISGQFDFILTNPPYIDPKIDRAEKSVKDFEPHLALYGGSNGMEIISKIISQAEHFLKRGGQLWIEHEPEQTNEVSLLAHEFGFLPTSYQDQYQTIRYSALVLQ
jgi:methylase of polypeptide subunit release factors